jgi:hypothetical protein
MKFVRTMFARTMFAKISLAVVLLALALAAPAGAEAQSRHDPLTEREVEILRESAREPKKRIEFLVGFIRERVLAIDRIRTFSRSGLDDGNKLGQLLGDVASLIDELDDNLDMYNKHSEDLRRPLRHVLEAEDDFQQKLKALSDAATPLQKRNFAGALADASDSLSSSAESARTMLADQLAKKGEDKSKEKPQASVSPGGMSGGDANGGSGNDSAGRPGRAEGPRFW